MAELSGQGSTALIGFFRPYRSRVTFLTVLNLRRPGMTSEWHVPPADWPAKPMVCCVALLSWLAGLLD